MTEEEKLKKEAEEKAKKRTKGFKCQDNCEKSYIMGALDFAEPREKQITVLSKHIIDLQKDKGNLTDKVRELEQQIEKMKKCNNCKHHQNETHDCRDFCYFEDVCKNHDKWEIKENDRREIWR